MDYNPWMSNLKNYRSSVCKKTGELQRFMYFHYSSQCEAKCAFLALRIYCWRLRTKIVSLIIRNPTTPLTLKPWSSSHHHLALQSRTFATTDQQWGQYFLEVVFELKIFILRLFLCSSKHSTFPPSPRPHKKRTASVACL